MSLAHVTLAVRDVARTTKFFENVFGWRPIHRPDNIAGTAGWLDIGNGNQIHLLQFPDFAPSAFEAEYGRHIAVFFPGTGFVELKQRLVDAGAEVISAKRATPFERFFFREPNGYVFEVIDEDGYKAE
ncbi:MAG: VOC family protein [Planctomycetaceae bacterium]|nr:VOC family protein [Planctomycetales bacterium]MCB9921313.1 VOC family protein [Planctomycetaceae bacterium]